MLLCWAAAHEAALAVTAEEGSWLPLLPLNAYGRLLISACASKKLSVRHGICCGDVMPAITQRAPPAYPGHPVLLPWSLEFCSTPKQAGNALCNTPSVSSQPTLTMRAVTGGLNATPESFFPTLPSLSLLVEDAAEGFSSLFSRTSADMPGAGDLEDSKTGAHFTPCMSSQL